MVKGEDTKNNPAHRGRIYRTCVECGFVGYGITSFPRNAKGMCKPCWKHKVKTKTLKPCKGCGVQFKPAHNVRYCSAECRKKHTGTYVESVECIVCGTKVDRYAHHVKKHKGACCSLECQRKHALEINRGFPKPTYGSRTKVKMAWYRARRMERRSKSLHYRWWQLAKSQVMDRNDKIDEWDIRSRAAVNCLNIRSMRFKGKRSDKRCTEKQWSSTFSGAMKLLNAKSVARSKTGWDARCTSAASNIKRRIKG